MSQQTPWIDPNPFPPWYSDDPDYDCPSGHTCVVNNNPFGPADAGKACSFTLSDGSTVSGEIYDGRSQFGQIFCAPDTDGDGTIDIKDKCPHDPTNSDTDCFNEYPDCTTLVRDAINLAAGSSTLTGLIVGWAGGFLKITVLATAGSVFIAGGVIIAVVGTAYCIFSDVENNSF